MRTARRRLWGIAGVLCCVAAVLALGAVYFSKGLQYWFPSYVRWSFSETWSDGSTHLRPVDIMLLIVDHFEPTKEENFRPWLETYPEIALRYRDADGSMPQYTWAFPMEQFDRNEPYVKATAELCRQGLGEIELQWHHARDTEESFRFKLREGIERFQRYGALITLDGKTAFGFVHGNWALDNSVTIEGRDRCGEAGELRILSNEGCFADFTFPASGSMAQPRKINSIYYAEDDPSRPKSYDWGVDVEAGRPAMGDLLIFEGPLCINWRDWKHVFYPSIEDGQLQANNPPTEVRVDQWVRVAIHVKGRPEWVFIKLFTHGASPQNWDFLLRGGLDSLFGDLTRRYNDGVQYRLHFVTARQAYNMVKAAEAGKQGNPGLYRDYLIRPYRNSGPAAG